MAQSKLVPADDLPKNLVPADDLPASAGKPVSTQDDYTIEAKIGEQRPVGGFAMAQETLGKEFLGGIQDVVNAIQGAQPSMPGALQGIAKAGLGVARTVGSPIAALGEGVGEGVGEAVRSGTQNMLGVEGSAAAGAATGALANVATQFLAAPLAISKVAPTLTKGAQWAASKLPGAQITLREMAKKTLEAFPTKLAPARPSKELYNELAQVNPDLPLPEFSAIAQRIADMEARKTKFGLGSQSLQDTASAIAAETKYHQQVPFDLVQSLRTELGNRIGELEAKGGAELGRYKQLFAGISESLENVGTHSAAFSKLKEANAAFSREKSLETLDNIFAKNMNRTLEGQEFTSSTFAKARNALRDITRPSSNTYDPLFEKGLGSANLKAIEKNLEEFAKLRINPPPKGVNVGSYLGGMRASGGYLAGQMMGLGNEAAMTLGAATYLTPPVISRIVQSKTGTTALASILKKEGTVSPQQVAGIMALIRAEQAASDGLPEEVLRALKGKDMSIEEKIQAVNLKEAVFGIADQASSTIFNRPTGQ